jgi:hypothetical protein
MALNACNPNSVVPAYLQSLTVTCSRGWPGEVVFRQMASSAVSTSARVMLTWRLLSTSMPAGGAGKEEQIVELQCLPVASFRGRCGVSAAAAHALHSSRQSASTLAGSLYRHCWESPNRRG